MVVERTEYEYDESLIEEAIKAFISDRTVHTGTTRETDLQARVDRINELVGVDNYYTGSQADEETVIDRLDTTQKTIVDINTYDMSKRPRAGCADNKLVRVYATVRLDICTQKGRDHANSVKREIDAITMLGIDVTFGTEVIHFDVTARKEVLSSPAKKTDKGYWRAFIDLPLYFDMTGSV